MAPAKLVAHLIGGVTVGELPGEFGELAERAYGGNEFVIPALPNQLFTVTAPVGYMAV